MLKLVHQSYWADQYFLEKGLLNERNFDCVQITNWTF